MTESAPHRLPVVTAFKAICKRHIRAKTSADEFGARMECALRELEPTLKLGDKVLAAIKDMLVAWFRYKKRGDKGKSQSLSELFRTHICVTEYEPKRRYPWLPAAEYPVATKKRYTASHAINSVTQLDAVRTAVFQCLPSELIFLLVEEPGAYMTKSMRSELILSCEKTRCHYLSRRFLQQSNVLAKLSQATVRFGNSAVQVFPYAILQHIAQFVSGCVDAARPVPVRLARIRTQEQLQAAMQGAAGLSNLAASRAYLKRVLEALDEQPSKKAKVEEEEKAPPAAAAAASSAVAV